MSRKALKVVVEVKFRAVSCPGVHLPAKDDIYLSMCFMGQYRKSECLPAIFPLLFHERMTFEKIFRHAVDPGDIAIMLEYETVRIELVQLIPPVGEALACFEEDARHFLFPEPKLVPSFSGVDREVLMTRAPHFPGIAPRLEFSTKTTISECSADAEPNIHPNVPMRPVINRHVKRSSRQKTSSPRRKRSQTLERRRGSRTAGDRHNTAEVASEIPRSHSLSPPRLAQLSLGSGTPDLANWDTATTSQHMLASWPGAGRSALPHRSAVLNNFSSSLTRSPSRVRYSSAGRGKSFSSGLVGGKSGEDSSSSETDDRLEYQLGPNPSAMQRSFREQARHSGSWPSSHGLWEEVQERVRGLLTTPKAVRRLVYDSWGSGGLKSTDHKISGATVSEIDDVLARRSISPGPP